MERFEMLLQANKIHHTAIQNALLNSKDISLSKAIMFVPLQNNYNYFAGIIIFQVTAGSAGAIKNPL